ncbi:Phosphatidylcholine:ceramide cholinephosphotransferase [Dirofilaria immitis]
MNNLFIESNKLAKTNISSKDGSAKKLEINNQDDKKRDENDLKNKEPESSTTKKSTLRSLKKIRDLFNISLKIRKEKKIPKPLQRLEESIVEDGELEKGRKKESAKLGIRSSSTAQRNISKTPDVDQASSIFVLDKTQSDETIPDIPTTKRKLPLSNESANLLFDDRSQGRALLETPVKYDPKILEVKVRRRLWRYAKISFCMTFIILSIIFIIFIIAMFGWWIAFSAHMMLNFERSVQLISDWENDEHDLLAKSTVSAFGYYAECSYQKISSLPWSSWTKCFRSTMQSVQWRWRNLSSGLYLIDQPIINMKWC